MKSFAMSCVLTKDKVGAINILGNLEIVEANNKNEAIGIYMQYINKKFPEHDIFDRVMFLNADVTTLKEVSNE